MELLEISFNARSPARREAADLLMLSIRDRRGVERLGVVERIAPDVAAELRSLAAGMRLGHLLE